MGQGNVVGGATTSQADSISSRWDRQAALYALRARTRRLSSSKRERACGLVPVIHATEHPSIKVTSEKGHKRASWKGLLTCGKVHGCCVCSARIRAERASRACHAVEGMGGWWQMLTITLRHRQGMSLKKLHRALMKTWRRTRQGGRVQRWWTERIRASIRAVEVTHGENGWHPHLHVLLAIDGMGVVSLRGLAQARRELFRRFARFVREELGEECVPSRKRGMVWSRPFHASNSDAEWRAKYVSKFACEVAGIAKEAQWAKSSTPWEVADRATRGDQAALRLWEEYLDAMHGARAIELDDRAAAAADAFEEKQRVSLAPATEDGETPEAASPSDGDGAREIQVHRDELRALRIYERQCPSVMWDCLRAAEEEGERGVRDVVAMALYRTGVPPPREQAA